MSEEASLLALIAPAGIAMLTMAMASKYGSRIALSSLLAVGAVALVVSFFVGFTVAWSVTSSPVLIWMTSFVTGVAIGMFGYLLTRERSHG